jgi:hypothetical protein
VTVEPVPANLPSVADARLPANYEAAKIALGECTRVDGLPREREKASA